MAGSTQPSCPSQGPHALCHLLQMENESQPGPGSLRGLCSPPGGGLAPMEGEGGKPSQHLVALVTECAPPLKPNCLVRLFLEVPAVSGLPDLILHLNMLKQKGQ